MGVMDFFDEVKYVTCGQGYITKETRKTFLWSLFTMAHKNDVKKEDAKTSLRKIESEILGDIKRIPKDKREFIVSITKKDIMEAFFGVYGTTVEEVRPKERERIVEAVDEPYEIDFTKVLDDNYAKKRGIVQGPTLREQLDVDFCTKLGVL